MSMMHFLRLIHKETDPLINFPFIIDFHTVSFPQCDRKLEETVFIGYIYIYIYIYLSGAYIKYTY